MSTITMEHHRMDEALSSMNDSSTELPKFITLVLIDQASTAVTNATSDTLSNVIKSVPVSPFNFAPSITD